ncbi:MAG TPA: twin-arginine translocase TatA/TatE family subunit [Candidatus Dormibacteraeota bacterium]|jgi:sec-independent protein translocase protein TatA|nr:twin-arginine translocase TatA/TatE family subunit [Candidatus Dormibacteraeota bacterium]
MPGLGLGHWWILLIIAALALIIFGPARLPELGAGLGRAIKEFRKGASELTDSLKEEATKPDSATAATHSEVEPPAEAAEKPKASPKASKG